jgi:hypothetical protein
MQTQSTMSFLCIGIRRVLLKENGYVPIYIEDGYSGWLGIVDW